MGSCLLYLFTSLPRTVVHAGQGCNTWVLVESDGAAEGSVRPKSTAQGHAAQCSWLHVQCSFHYTMICLSWGSLRISSRGKGVITHCPWRNLIDETNWIMGGIEVRKTLREEAACLRLHCAHWTRGSPCSVWLCTEISVHWYYTRSICISSQWQIPFHPKCFINIRTREGGPGQCPCGPWHRWGFGIIWEQTWGPLSDTWGCSAPGCPARTWRLGRERIRILL